MRRPPRWKLIAWGIPAWAIVVFVWVMAIRNQPWGLWLGLAIGLVALVLAVIAVWSWVAHNRALARRREAARGGRRGAPDVPLVVTEDRRGRPVRIAEGAREARMLVARIEDGAKIIEPDPTA